MEGIVDFGFGIWDFWGGEKGFRGGKGQKSEQKSSYMIVGT
jgi:hypothetical protein